MSDTLAHGRLHPIGTRVQANNGTAVSGTVVGFGLLNREEVTDSVYLVELDHPWVAPGQGVVTILPVAPYNVGTYCDTHSAWDCPFEELR